MYHAHFLTVISTFSAKIISLVLHQFTDEFRQCFVTSCMNKDMSVLYTWLMLLVLNYFSILLYDVWDCVALKILNCQNIVQNSANRSFLTDLHGRVYIALAFKVDEFRKICVTLIVHLVWTQTGLCYTY